MNAPLARFLVEFSAVNVVEPEFDPLEPTAFEPLESEPPIVLTASEFEAALADARAASVLEERARLEAEALARFEEERASLQASFAAERESWANEQGARIGETLTAAIAQLEGDLSTALANALRPLFAEACRSRILAEVGTALAAILSDPGHPPLRIEGPVDLLTAFGAAHASDVSIDYVVSEGATELTVTTDVTRIETRLSACLTSLAL